LIQAFNAFEHCALAETVSARDLRPLLIAAKSPASLVWQSALELLPRLARKHAAVRDAMLDMLNSKKVHERFNVIASLTSCVPKSLARKMIRQALNDKGARVRLKAAEAADRLNLRDLIPDLERSLAAETNANAKINMEFSTAMLRDGYHLTRENGEPSLWVRAKSGWTYAHISDKQIEQGKLKTIAARARRDSA
jgi:hypothetical protein